MTKLWVMALHVLYDDVLKVREETAKVLTRVENVSRSRWICLRISRLVHFAVLYHHFERSLEVRKFRVF